MNSGKYVFSQLLQYINGYEFDKLVKKYNGDYRKWDARHLANEVLA